MCRCEVNALDITSGAELLQFDMGEVVIAHTYYSVLTGYEGTDRCWWCGGEPHRNTRGRRAHFCWGHGRVYAEHFNWDVASLRALKRAEHRCENCGKNETHEGFYKMTNLEVHHIVPLNGAKRMFSAYNLPWNLLVLCHKCHQLIHAVMRGELAVRRWMERELDIFERAAAGGQAIMPLITD